LGAERNTAFRMFVAARTTTTPSAQTEFWLEFQWIDHEYRYAVRRLSQFCTSFEAQVMALRVDATESPAAQS